MCNKALAAVLLALSAIAALAAPIATAEQKTGTGVRQDVGQSPRALKWQNTRYGVDAVQCDGVAEPQLPTAVPGWAAESANDLSNDRSVQELGGSGAFVKGSEIVIKKCTTDALEAAVDHVRPQYNSGSLDPNFDIFFDCGPDSRYIIYVRGELELGNGSSDTGGTYRLMAPGFNVELNGSKKYRIIRVNKNAHLTVFGLEFRHGHQVNTSWQIDDRPSGGWNGGAILVSYSASVVAYKCMFRNNTASSRYVRWGSGGAIMAETDSSLLVWDCAFRFNHGTNAGALGASSARVVNVIKSTFHGNVGHGGYDGSKKVNVNGKSKTLLTVRSGAMRVDSVTGHDSSDEHVMVCNSVFEMNRIVFTREELAEFGYAESEVEHIRAGGAAFSVWNSEGNLHMNNNDRNLLTVKGCVFDGNYEDLPWGGSRMGMFVFEAEGEGHIELSDVTFSKNQVQDAICRLGNSDRFGRDAFELTLRNVRFKDNGKTRAFRFHEQSHNSLCEFRNVDGFRDGKGDCWDFL